MPSISKNMIHHSLRARIHARRYSPHRMALLPSVLFALSFVMIAVAGVLFSHYGPTGYFALTGRPFQWPGVAPAAARAEQLPVFATTQTISAASLAPGESLTINISATSNKTTSAEVKAWITSPKHKQVWRSLDDKLSSFTAGQAAPQTFAFVLPATLAPGKYHVSFTISSADEYSDFLVKEDFAEFSVK